MLAMPYHFLLDLHLANRFALGHVVDRVDDIPVDTIESIPIVPLLLRVARLLVLQIGFQVYLVADLVVVRSPIHHF